MALERSMLVAVYRSVPTRHQAPGGYWFLRIVNPVTNGNIETPLTAGKAAEFILLGVPQLKDGGGL